MNTPLNSLNSQSKDNNNSFEIIPGIIKEPDYKTLLSNCRISVNDIIPIPPICIEIIIDGVPHTFGTLGDFTLLIGKAKAGKTFALSLILAAALVDGRPFQKVLLATFPNDKKTVLYFDTEQSKYYVQKALKRICDISGVPEPYNLIIYSLRGLTPAERLGAIEFAIYNTENIGMAVIDGIRDLITSINDEEQASMIASKLLKWTGDLNIHIITVLHQNKSDLHARGHLGTELTNKSQTVVSVSKAENKNVSVITAEFCRDKDFEPIAFSIDLNGLPNIIDDYTPKNKAERKNKVLLPGEIAIETHIEIIAKVLKVDRTPKYKELCLGLKNEISSWYGYHIADARVREYVKYYTDKNLLFTVGKTPHTRYQNLKPDTLK